MDDIQFWIYILFGIIYVVTRALRKKKPEEASPQEGNQGERPARSQPKSFEELLKEFTDVATEEEAPTVEQRPSAPVGRQPIEQQPSPARSREFELEGETRHFADDESRKIYEASIRQAEGAAIAYERDEHFKIKKTLQRDADERGGGTEVAREIREILSSPQSAKKAVILSEIFNRKY